MDQVLLLWAPISIFKNLHRTIYNETFDPKSRERELPSRCGSGHRIHTFQRTMRWPVALTGISNPSWASDRWTRTPIKYDSNNRRIGRGPKSKKFVKIRLPNYIINYIYLPVGIIVPHDNDRSRRRNGWPTAPLSFSKAESGWKCFSREGRRKMSPCFREQCFYQFVFVMFLEMCTCFKNNIFLFPKTLI